MKDNTQQTQIPTWEELESSGQFDDYGAMARYWCRLHVKAALQAAADNAKYKVFEMDGNLPFTMDEDSILNAYPPDKIK